MSLHAFNRTAHTRPSHRGSHRSTPWLRTLVALAFVCVGYGFAMDLTGGDREAARLAACSCFIIDHLLFALGTSRAVYVSRLADSPQIQAYLSGQSIVLPGPDGWVLVGTDGFALGWGKRVNGRLKNHYPRGLRQPAY